MLALSSGLRLSGELGGVLLGEDAEDPPNIIEAKDFFADDKKASLRFLARYSSSFLSIIHD